MPNLLLLGLQVADQDLAKLFYGRFLQLLVQLIDLEEKVQLYRILQRRFVFEFLGHVPEDGQLCNAWVQIGDLSEIHYYIISHSLSPFIWLILWSFLLIKLLSRNSWHDHQFLTLVHMGLQSGTPHLTRATRSVSSHVGVRVALDRPVSELISIHHAVGNGVLSFCLRPLITRLIHLLVLQVNIGVSVGNGILSAGRRTLVGGQVVGSG